MASQVSDKKCPHCGASLDRLQLPDEAGYDVDRQVHLVCFNDDCPYYREGWEWMQEQYEVKASYRYRLDPVTNVASPLAVWSEGALKDRIVVD